MRFGYLPQSDKETGNLRTEDQLRDAIRTLQAYGHIPVTGEIDVETEELLRKPRCAVADVPEPGWLRVKRYTLQGGKWDYSNLTWSLRTMDPFNLDPGMVRYQLDKALKVWSDNSRLTFREVNSDRADILVYFHRGYHGDGFPFDGRGQILAHAFFPGEGRGGDAHFDEEEQWLLRDEEDDNRGTSLFAVAAHEFGHSLGLQHSTVKGALMYPWYQGLSPNYQLPDDDRHGIQQLYGANERLWGRIPAYPNYPYDKPAERPRPNYPQNPEIPNRVPRPTEPPRRQPERPTEPSTTTTSRPSRPERPERPYRPEKPKPEKPHKPHKPVTTPRPPPVPPPPPPPPQPPPTASPPTKPVRPTHKKEPERCDTDYDAISIIRREVFIFKDRYFWRIGDKGLERRYPTEITQFWYQLPKNFTHVDAVYERLDTRIVFFIGKQYYLYQANNLVKGYPKPLTDLGLPESLDKVDAAMVWGHNKKTYFYSGTMYWRFDEETGKVELDYPRDMSMWRGIGYNIDTVFQWKDGKTYFFKGKGFWKFNDQLMRVENEQQTPSAPFWMGCPREMESTLPPEKPLMSAKEIDTSSALLNAQISLMCVLLSLAFLYCNAEFHHQQCIS